MDVIEQKVHNHIREHHLLNQGDTLIVGVSGGADSMMLLDFLCKYQNDYGIDLKVAHVHHGLRDEADADEAHVAAYCRERQIPFYSTKINIKNIANEKKLSEEEAGRIIRYEYFTSLTNPCDKIATAHTMSDQAETLMMRFFRGSDVKGLAGIPVKRERIIRPILCLTRDEVETYCRINNLAYKIDETNLKPIYTRNKIRLHCLPYIKDNFNANIEETLYQQATLYKEQSDFVAIYVERFLKEHATYEENCIKIGIKKLEKEAIYIQKKVIYESIIRLSKTAKDIGYKHVQQCIELLNSQTGKQTHLPYGVMGLKQYEDLILKRQKEQNKEVYNDTLEEGINDLGQLRARCILTLHEFKTIEQTTQNRYTKYIDYDKIKDNLQIRTRKTGDFITLKNGTKKIKKFFIDEKLPKEKRDNWPLIADGQEIVWVIGSRLNSKYFVTEVTKKILEIKYIHLDTQEGLE